MLTLPSLLWQLGGSTSPGGMVLGCVLHFWGPALRGGLPQAHMAVLPRGKRAIHSERTGKTESPSLPPPPAFPQTSLSLRQFSALQLCQRSLMSAWLDVISSVAVQLKRCISFLLEESRGRRRAECPMPSHLKESLRLERNSPFSSAF